MSDTTGTVRWTDGSPQEAVAVSDGVHWTLTDHLGRYSLPRTARPIWIRRPVDGLCEQWWRSRDPEGAATDFTLTHNDGVLTRIAHLSDPHLSLSNSDSIDGVELANRFGDNTNGAAGLITALTAAQRAGAQLAVITGDLTDHGTPAEYELLRTVLDRSPIPVEVIPGNHDHYGHHHEPAPADRPIGGGFLGTATTWRYEKLMGPRWWSAEIGPFHVLALDWFSYTCGIDCDDQEAFIRSDLDTSDPRRPLVVLTHDVPCTRLLDLITAARPHTKISVLSGHWHVTVDRQIDDIHYITAPPTSFGGFDWSAPSWHLLQISSDHSLHRRTHHTWPRHRLTSPARVVSMLWSPPDGHTQHAGNLTGVGQDAVAIPTTHHGQAHATVLDHRDGRLRWTTPVDGDAITSLTTCGDTVIATTFSGTLTCLDCVDGTVRWSHTLPAAHRMRLLNGPTLTPDGTLITGSLDEVSGLCARTGELLWSTSELGPVDTLMTYGRGLACHDLNLVVLPFGGPYRGLTAFDMTSGAVVWTQATPPAAPSALVPIPSTDDALVLRTDTQTLERFTLATGSAVWSAPIAGGFTTTTPLVIGDRIIAICGDGTINRLDPATGAPTTEPTHLRHGRQEGWGPYRSSGIGIATDPVVIGTQAVAVTVSGEVWTIDPTGSEQLAATLGHHVTTQPVVTTDNQLITQTADAQLHKHALLEHATLAHSTPGAHQ